MTARGERGRFRDSNESPEPAIRLTWRRLATEERFCKPPPFSGGHAANAIEVRYLRRDHTGPKGDSVVQ